MRSLIEDLRQIAASFLLHKDCSDQKLEIGYRHAAAQVEHGLAERQAEALLIGGTAELCAQRIVAFPGDGFDGGGECLASAESARHQVNRFRQQFRKPASSPLAFLQEKEI